MVANRENYEIWKIIEDTTAIFKDDWYKKKKGHINNRKVKSRIKAEILPEEPH